MTVASSFHWRWKLGFFAVLFLFGSIYYYYSRVAVFKVPEFLTKKLQNETTTRTKAIDDELTLLSSLAAIFDEKLCAGKATTSANLNECVMENRHRIPAPIGDLPPDSRSVVLVVGFNMANSYFVAPLIYSMYAPLFSAVRFCGPSGSRSDFATSIGRYFNEPISQALGSLYVGPYLPSGRPETFHDAGESVYYCVNLALSDLAASGKNNRSEFTGVLFVQDDVAVSSWLIGNNRNQSSLTTSYTFPYDDLIISVDSLARCQHDDTKCSGKVGWYWAPFYQQNSLNFLKELNDVASKDGGLFSKCLAELVDRSGGNYRVFGGLSDAFYVAKQHLATVLPLFELARKHQVFQEIAVPTIMACLGRNSTGLLDLSGNNSNRATRKSAFLVFDANRLFMHPFKLSRLVKALAATLTIYNDQQQQPISDDVCLFCLLFNYTRPYLFQNKLN